ncbi:glycosyl hydrolase 115 family protein [Aestuariibaculum sediminum]|uniref:Glycosyl hydrolase 115 family protein n=1 Tax=Aestuariibaculum sediminum TaxID=2770637 RepID=A0A8J6Q7A9_9FLAO|nr:glycosyl hydrolase 115 family protein [Aestuariibaculum sediminum]MBD0831560.1 glycosyl hydrolase 115 family protein [Aestuariibaculum sediminum]
MNFCLRTILTICFCLLILTKGFSISDRINSLITFEVYTAKHKSTIVYDKEGTPLDSISAHLLAEDIFKVTNYKPEIITNLKQAKGNVIIIGNINSKLINAFIKSSEIPSDFKNQWESYLYKTIAKPSKSIKKAFIIAGTTPRGTAYGVFNISKEIGVNPWYWWADVPVKSRKELILDQSDSISKAPSVKFRGIFLNDEDWGLQPWASKTLEPETGDIGPKTYAKIFELLLRLNANTIWPAMHPSTKAFFHYPGNAKMAEMYNIVIGSSHAEPMLRNNVDEWDKKTLGDFNYKTNKNAVFNYWENRVKEAKNIDAIYTMGMRGVHDSGMEGVKSKDEAVALLDGILKDQRQLLKTYINEDPTKIPQAFTVYKEVLDLYKNGLEVPDDITLVWTDDNYGYIRSLSNPEEQKRSGGGGVYYHASYWGRPHDYLWLSTTSPCLVWEEMIKAYTLNNKTIWILNVGDIKPAEYNTQLFLDMAYNASKFETIEAVNKHQEDFFTDIFGEKYGKTIANIKAKYYQLAFERKPEFMGWSQTEPTTPIYQTAYNSLGYGDEISKRISAYKTIENKTQKIAQNLPKNLKSSFFQLVAYPVEAASNMNKKFLYRDLALTYAKQNRISAKKHKDSSNLAYQNIITLTEKYNALSNGKWQGIMHMKPRNLPVYQNPEITLSENSSKDILGIAVEDTLRNIQGISKLPTFYENDFKSYFIDVFLKSENETSWKLTNLPKWLNFSKTNGILNPKNTPETRIYVSIDWKLWNQSRKPLSEIITLESGDFKEDIEIQISENYSNLPKNSIIEKNGLAVWYAHSFSKNEEKNKAFWQILNGLGHSQHPLQASPVASESFSEFKNTPVLEYDIYAETINPEAHLNIVALPTHPLTTSGQVRIGVQWNDSPIKIIDFKTEGRSSTWKQNVLSNTAKKQMQIAIDKTGKQTLKIYMIDAGVVLDYFILNTKSQLEPYSLPAETKIYSHEN